ncbi:hypothetical protein N431DRAFT_472284 [Stipitochalara longipes BDJ]|nr:hypothetical protein N431DRAFT_472284 [Stipitochalara longipes BDJ]
MSATRNLARKCTGGSNGDVVVNTFRASAFRFGDLMVRFWVSGIRFKVTLATFLLADVGLWLTGSLFWFSLGVADLVKNLDIEEPTAISTVQKARMDLSLNERNLTPPLPIPEDSVQSTIEKNGTGDRGILVKTSNGIGGYTSPEDDDAEKAKFRLIIREIQTTQFVPDESYVDISIEDRKVRSYLNDTPGAGLFIVVGLKIVKKVTADEEARSDAGEDEDEDEASVPEAAIAEGNTVVGDIAEENEDESAPPVDNNQKLTKRRPGRSL